MVLIFTWMLLSAIVAAAAQSRGRSAGQYFLLSFLLSPLLAVIILVLTKPTRAETEAIAARGGDVKRCPLCAELVKLEATFCKHCHQPIPADAVIIAPVVGTQVLPTAHPSSAALPASPAHPAPRPPQTALTVTIVLLLAVAASFYVFFVLGY